MMNTGCFALTLARTHQFCIWEGVLGEPQQTICGNLLLRLVPITGRSICISIGTPIRIYRIMITNIRLGGSTLWLTVRLSFRIILFFRHSVWEACSLSLIPDTHISSPSHRPSTSRYSASYVCPLVEHTPHWVPCRWLAGDNQVILIPYFIRSSFLRTYSLHSVNFYSLFSYSLLILYRDCIWMSRLYYSFLIRWLDRFTVSSRSRVVPIRKGYIFSHSLLILYHSR